jgi:excisionase family DNA binding protein
MTDQRRSYTTIEVAKRLGVSLPTVKRWVDAGHLKAWKTIGGHRRIDPSSAEQLFAAQEAVAGTPAAAPARVREVAPEATVLIVEDDAIDRELLNHLVHKALPRARIEIAENGFQGLLLAGRVAPRVVVTDIQMPHMNGLEMIRQLLFDSATRPHAVLAVSAYAESGLATVGQLPDGVQFFSKPVDAARFVAALRIAAAKAEVVGGQQPVR